MPYAMNTAEFAEYSRNVQAAIERRMSGGWSRDDHARADAARTAAYERRYPRVIVVGRTAKALRLMRPDGQLAVWLPKAACRIFEPSRPLGWAERPDKPANDLRIAFDIVRADLADWARAKFERNT